MREPNDETVDVAALLDEDVAEFPLVDNLIEGFQAFGLLTISEEDELSDETSDEEVFVTADDDDYETKEDESEATGVEVAEQLCCICEGVECGLLIRCDNPYCKFEWFHFDCVGLEEAPSEGLWYCTNCCQESSGAD